LIHRSIPQLQRLAGALSLGQISYQRVIDKWGLALWAVLVGRAHVGLAPQVDPIVADGRLRVCDGRHTCFSESGVDEPAQAELGRGTLQDIADCPQFERQVRCRESRPTET
jgi:hypothetical protein